MITNYKQRYALLAIHEKYIFWNVFFFAISAISMAIFGLFNIRLSLFRDLFWLSNSFSEFPFKPWTLFTYAFLHSGFWHLISNMIGFYFFGRIFLTFYNDRQFQNIYWVGAIYAGLIFIIAYAVFPMFNNVNAVLVGSSGAMFAILFAATAKSPHYVLNLFGVLRLKLWVLSAVYTIFFLVSIDSPNAGGQFAHLGGALFGYIASKQLDKGNNICRWFELVVDYFSGLFTKKSKLKVVHKSSSKPKRTYTNNESKTTEKQQKIDAILDKISKSGYQSLTKAERNFLAKASEE